MFRKKESKSPEHTAVGMVAMPVPASSDTDNDNPPGDASGTTKASSENEYA